MYALKNLCITLIMLVAFPLTAIAETPQLICAGGIGTSPDLVNFNLSGACSKIGHQSSSQSKAIQGWLTTPNADSVGAVCRHSNLTAQAAASVTHTCVGLPDGGAQLVVGVQAQALAGWDNNQSCDGGNYCSANASAGGSAATSFDVGAAQVNKYCVGIVSFNGVATATKGYPTSGWFTPGSRLINTVVFSNPGGKTLALTAGATYLLNVQGTWRLLIPTTASISSNMAENSGTYNYTQTAILRFVQANADGTCPVPQLTAAAREKALSVSLSKATMRAANSAQLGHPR